MDDVQRYAQELWEVTVLQSVLAREDEAQAVLRERGRAVLNLLVDELERAGRLREIVGRRVGGDAVGRLAPFVEARRDGSDVVEYMRRTRVSAAFTESQAVWERLTGGS